MGPSTSVENDEEASAGARAKRRGVVVVTGASAGVGRATALAFARQGAKVALVARGEAGLAGAVAEIEEAGGQAKSGKPQEAGVSA